MSILQACVLAFVAMCVQDLLSTAMVVTESHGSAYLAGFLDVGEYLTVIVCSSLAIGAVLKEGWRSKRSLAIIGSVSAANFVGTVAGTSIAFGLLK